MIGEGSRGMARARNIKPGFFINDQLAEIEPLGRLLFAGLWTIADREGRLEDRPKKIKAEILPYDNCDANILLDALNDAEFICRYTVDGQNYIQIINFSKHQNPHPKEAQSIIPAIPCKESEKQLTSNLQESGESITKNADSLIPLILISDSLIPLPPTAVEDIYEHWQSQKIVVHDNLTDTMEAAIKKALKDNTKYEIKESITHFSLMLKDELYELCTYAWGIETFLTRKKGYKLFLSGGEKWLNYQSYIKGRASPASKDTAQNKAAIVDQFFNLEGNGSG